MGSISIMLFSVFNFCFIKLVLVAKIITLCNYCYFISETTGISATGWFNWTSVLVCKYVESYTYEKQIQIRKSIHSPHICSIIYHQTTDKDNKTTSHLHHILLTKLYYAVWKCLTTPDFYFYIYYIEWLQMGKIYNLTFFKWKLSGFELRHALHHL